jgi:outer membrane protein insertion porin family/translocation and assembly module TamA
VGTGLAETGTVPASARDVLGSTTLVAVLSLGCASIPQGTAAVDGVSIQGNHELSDSDIEDKMATASSAKFLGVFRGVVYDYQIFDRSVLQRDLERLERYYRARGFYDAQVRAGRIRYRGDKHVEVTIEVEEGSPVLVRDLQIDGLEGLPKAVVKAARSAMHASLSLGKRFEEDPFQRAENDMKRALTDRGYAWAKVERRADVDLPGHYAHLVFDVHAGPTAKFGALTVEGVGELPAAPVRRTADIDEGAPYSTADVAKAQQAVLDLGTFSGVDIIPNLTAPGPEAGVVPLVVKVQPQKLKSVLLGGGIELDSIRAELHLHVGWEHKNLFSGFRHFTVDLKPGFDLYPTRVPTFQKPTTVLPEERLRVELRQPGFLEARTNGVISSEFNTYPLLLSPAVDPTAPVLGYVEYKGSVGLDRTFWKLFLAPSYDFQWNDPFAYVGARDPNLQSLILSYVDLLAHFDFRDNTLNPHKGLYVQNDLQFAGLGGAARDVRIQPEVRGYVPLGSKVTLAARVTVGLLFPLNYGAAAAAAAGNPVVGPARADWIKDIEIIYLRGFFSGGPSSNRGYPLRGIGPHGVVPFFNPGLQAAALTSGCNDPSSSMYSAYRCAQPVGGESIWEASLELRFPILGPLSGTTFCDTSDVSPDRLSVRLDYPHLSCGLGLRYATPIGPVRVDVGYRIPGAQVPKGVNPILVDGDPGAIFGAPIAFAFGIGEAF